MKENIRKIVQEIFYALTGALVIFGIIIIFLILSVILIINFKKDKNNLVSTSLNKVDVADTIADTDSNNDGVRDDVQIYIDSLSISSEGRKALLDLARGVQNLMLSDNKDDASSAMNIIIKAMDKYYQTEDDKKYLNEIEAKVVNTPDRLQSYINANKLLGGTIW